MPKIKLNGVKARESKSGFEPYDGPVPTQRGFYRAIIKKITHGRNNKGSMGFNIVAELEAAPGDPKGHAQFDGYPLFIRNVITAAADGAAMKEGSQRTLENFLAAVGSGDEPDILLEDGEDGEFVVVKKIGKRNPVGVAVNIDLGTEVYEGEKRPTANGIYKLKDDAAAGKSSRAVVEDEEEDLLEGSDEEEEFEDGDIYSSEELAGMTIAELRAIAKELEVDTKGLKKADLVDAIVDAQGEEDEDDSPAALDEDEPDEDDEELDEDEADDEDDEEDDEEEDDEDDEAEQERRDELQTFNRVALKKVLKEIAPDFTPLKRHTDDDLRDQIIDIEFGEDTPF